MNKQKNTVRIILKLKENKYPLTISLPKDIHKIYRQKLGRELRIFAQCPFTE